MELPPPTTSEVCTFQIQTWCKHILDNEDNTRAFLKRSKLLHCGLSEHALGLEKYGAFHVSYKVASRSIDRIK